MGFLLRRLVVLGIAVCGAIGLVRPVLAQVTPAEGIEPIDDTPFVKVGGTLFLDYTYTDEPSGIDVNGDAFDPSSFNVGRAYINVTGQVHHLVSFRITPDVVRETGTGSTASGSYTFRIKYAYGQVNFDQWMGKGTWVRFGEHQTPYVEYTENIYRYRFQGTIFVDREGYLTSSDAGISFHWNFPRNFGDVHVGYYNGDGYAHFDANDEKAIQARVSFRPTPGIAVLQGLRVTAFYDGDGYASGDPKQRLVGQLTFEHKWVNAGVEYLDTKDKINDASPRVNGKGYSIWATPRTSFGLEGLLRYDDLEPNDALDNAHKKRSIAGVAYWLPVMKGVATAALLDYEQVKYDDPLAKPKEVRYALHTLIQF